MSLIVDSHDEASSHLKPHLGPAVELLSYEPGHAIPQATPSISERIERDRLESFNFTPANSQASEDGLSSLAGVDGGFGSWSYLASAFFVEMIIWGFVTSYGTFLESYLRESDIINQPHATSLLPLVGTLSSGIMYCTGPLTYPLVSRYRHYRKPAMWIGTIISWASLFAASFTRKITTLLLLQGVLYAIGGSILYPAAMSYMSEWFVAKRGLALGVIDAGNAMGGLILPLILPKLIRAHGTSLTLRYLSFGVLIGIMVTLPFIKPRLSERGTIIRPSQRVENKAWLQSSHLWLSLLVNVIQGFAWFIPLIWLPTYTAELGVSSSTASLSLALLNGASIFSRLSLGMISDYISPWLLAFVVASTTSAATLLLWGVAGHALAGVFAYSILFGGITGGWSSIWSAFVKPVAKDDISLYVSLFGYFMLTRGLANVLSTPISNALSPHAASTSLYKRNTGFDVAGGRFKSMILFTGACFAGASVISFIAWQRERKRR